MKRITKAADPPSVNLARLASVPRDVQLTASGRFVTAVAIVLAAAAVTAAIGLSVLRVSQQAARDRVAREGVSALATITRVTLTKGEEPRRVVDVRYPAPDGDRERRIHLSEDDSRDVAQGGTLPIVYLRSEPDRIWLAGEGPRVVPLFVLPAVPITLLFVAGLVAWCVRRDYVLLTEGRLTEARVISSTSVQRQHHRAFRVNYEFTTFSGGTMTGSVERGKSPAAAVGATVPVVYHRDNPRRNAIYPLSLVRPARW